MDFQVKVDDTKAQLKFKVLPDNVRLALFTTAQALEHRLVALVRQRASGGVVGVRSGEYLHSIRGTTRQSKNAVTATTRSKSPLAAIIEGGANIPAHDELPNMRRAMRFGGGAGMVFAAVVHHPAVVLPPRKVIEGAFESMKDEIVAGMTTAAKTAAAGGNS